MRKSIAVVSRAWSAARRGRSRRWARNSPGTSGFRRARFSADAPASAASLPYFSSAGPSIQMPNDDSGERAPIARHLLAQHLVLRGVQARRRHIASASPARSSPCRASARTRASALPRRRSRCGRPRNCPRRSSSAGAFRPGNWPRARRGRRGGIVRVRERRLSSAGFHPEVAKRDRCSLLGWTLAAAGRNSTALCDGRHRRRLC